MLRYSPLIMRCVVNLSAQSTAYLVMTTATTATLARSLRVCGIGADITYVPRFRELMARHGDRFIGKSLHPAEIHELKQLSPSSSSSPSQHSEYSDGQLRYIASRWAIKEALVKSTGVRLLFPELRIQSSLPLPSTRISPSPSPLPSLMGDRSLPAPMLPHLFKSTKRGITFPQFGRRAYHPTHHQPTWCCIKSKWVSR